MTVISNSAEYWMKTRNIEAIGCRLPTFEDICNGVHIVWALGNDLLEVGLYVDTDASREVSDSPLQLTQLFAFDPYLRQIRYEGAA